MKNLPLGFDDRGEDPDLLEVDVVGILTAPTSSDVARETSGDSPSPSSSDSLEQLTSTDPKHLPANTSLEQSGNDLVVTGDHVAGIAENSRILRRVPIPPPIRAPPIGNQFSS